MSPRALLEQAVAAHRAGRLQQAVELYQGVLRQQPENADALNLLGLCARQGGDLRAAEELIGRAVGLRPRSGDFRNNLGDTLLAQGRLQDAVAAFREAVRLRPDLHLARYNLGLALQQQGDLAGAERAYRRVLRSNPEFAEAHAFLGVCLHWQGRPGEAVEEYRRALALNPELPDAWFHLGAALREQGALEQAGEALGRAIGLRSGHAESHHQLALAHMELRDLPAAEEALERALALAPEAAHLHVSRGNLLEMRESAEQAQASYERALALDPQLPEAFTGLGRVQQARGDLEAAAGSFRRALELRPDYAVPRYNLVRLGALPCGPGESDEPAAIDAMNALLRRAQPDGMETIALHLALAGLHERRGEFGEAFRQVSRANALKRPRAVFDADAQSALVGETIGTFSPDFLRAREGYGDPSEVPVFIVGMPRSGTTLVEQIVSSHPRVHGAGEVDFLNRARRLMAQRLGSVTPYPGSAALVGAPLARELAATALEELRGRAPEAARITDKMPLTFLYLGLVRMLLPRARIIHCRRDPLDTCVSIYTVSFPAGHPYAYDLYELGRYYRDYERLMEHWRGVFGDSMLELSYEDLVQRQEPVSRRMIEYLGLDWDPRCLSFTENERAVLSTSSVQVRKPMYSSSLGRWRDYREFLGPLMQGLGAVAVPGDGV